VSDMGTPSFLQLEVTCHPTSGPLITIYFTLLEISKELPGRYCLEHNIVVSPYTLIDTGAPPHICYVTSFSVTSTFVWVQYLIT
jgi:hypothetical protein